MAGFPNVKTFADAQDTDGKEWLHWFHKTGSPVLTAAGMWGDLSVAAGTPKYNAYVGVQGEGTPLIGDGNFGHYTGPAAPEKHITEIAIGTPGATFAPASFILCDYLYHYPLTDMDSTDVQPMDNSVAPVPRYADGAGVRAMLVTTTPQSATARCLVTYTNAAGVTGCTSSVFTAVSNTGMIQGANQSGAAAGTFAPFVPLASGDTGVRAIESVQNLASAGGFCAVVLVRPLATILLRELDTIAEVNYLIHRRQLPRVLAGACLGFVFTSGVAAASSVIRGNIKFTWS